MLHGRQALIGTAVATATAAVLLCPVAPAVAGDRAVVSHILVGVAADTSFSVSVEGAPLPDAPFQTDESGILSFEVDDTGLPPGPIEVSVASLALSPMGPPIIGGITFREVTATSVAVSWSTDRPATSQVRYGTKGDFDFATRPDTTHVTEHEVIVEPIVPRLSYSFVVLSACGADTACGEIGWFQTAAPPSLGVTPLALGIVRPRVQSVTETGAVVRWATDRPCSTWVECGQNESFGRSSEGTAVGDCGYEAVFDGLAPGTAYAFRVCAKDAFGAYAESPADTFRTPGGVGGGDADGGAAASPENPPQAALGLASSFSLSVRPNPAANDALLAFTLPEPGHVRASIYSAAGRLVRVLADREYPAGAHACAWDLRSGDGAPAASGAYLCALETPVAVVTRKLVVVR